MDIDPVIQKYITLINNEDHCKKVSIIKVHCRLQHFFEHSRFKFLNQFSNWHTADKIRPFNQLSLFIDLYFQCIHSIVCPKNFFDLCSKAELTTLLLYYISDCLPHHAWP